MDVKKYLHESTKDDPIIETFDSIVNGGSELSFVKENTEYYFIKQYNGDPYDDLMWAVNKATGEVFWLDLLDFMFEIEDYTTVVEPPYSNLTVGT